MAATCKVHWTVNVPKRAAWCCKQKERSDRQSELIAPREEEEKEASALSDDWTERSFAWTINQLSQGKEEK